MLVGGQLPSSRYFSSSYLAGKFSQGVPFEVSRAAFQHCEQEPGKEVAEVRLIDHVEVEPGAGVDLLEIRPVGGGLVDE